MRNLLACGAAIAAGLSTPASAAWHVAESKHFVIYADDNPKRLEAFAAQLERFDQAVRYATIMEDPEIGKGNRLTVFVMPTEKDVRALKGDKTGFYSGFYSGRIEGSLAYVSKEGNDPNRLDRNAIFFHEYTHHLMKQDLERPYPEWYVEGYAEFFSTPQFERDGSVWLGRVVQGRAYGLLAGPQLPLETLLQGMNASLTNAQRDVFYGRSWLLAHYLLMDQRRRGQLSQYLSALSNGASSIEAARQTFGDITQLDKELNAYKNRALMKFQVPANVIRQLPVAVKPLSAAASQAILTRARIKNGVRVEEAEALAGPFRALSTQTPGDELVETTLAEIELKTDHADAAKAAAERALKANPASIEAMILRGRALAKIADAADHKVRHEMFEQARRDLVAANKLDTEDPEPLVEFYRTFLTEGVRPTANAIAALHYASDLAPQDLGVRMNSAIAYLNENKPKEARATLAVVAYSPHVGTMGEIARKMMTAIDAGNPRGALMELRRAPRQEKSE